VRVRKSSQFKDHRSLAKNGWRNECKRATKAFAEEYDRVGIEDANRRKKEIRWAAERNGLNGERACALVS